VADFTKLFTIVKENDVDQFKSDLLLMIFWLIIINYNSELNLNEMLQLALN
jgi:hypothetical protein